MTPSSKMLEMRPSSFLDSTLRLRLVTHKTHILDHVFSEERQGLDGAALSAGEKLKQKLRLAGGEGKELRTVLNRHFSRLKPILGRAADLIQ